MRVNHLIEHSSATAVNCANYLLCRRGWLSIARLDHEAIPLAAVYSLDPSLLRNGEPAAKDILLDLARRCFRQLGLPATLNR